ncbi:MAG: helix-turn-helix domain-containing protein [Moraxellaceae bacterium]|nr:helix-turn-helix domain-containing protein [Moraxellaceae bacterium]
MEADYMLPTIEKESERRPMGHTTAELHASKSKHTFVSLEQAQLFLAHGRNIGIPVDDILSFYNTDLRRDTPKPGYVPGHIWEMCAIIGADWCRRLGDPLAGFSAAIALGNSFLGLWGFIVEKSVTLGKAIDVAITYKNLHADTLDLVVRNQPGYLDVVVSPVFRSSVACAHAADFYLVHLNKLVRHCTGGAQGVTEGIYFQHEQPETPALLERYRAEFKCPLYFGAPENVLRLPVAALNLPLITADAPLQHDLVNRARNQLKVFEQEQEDIGTLARRHLRTLIAGGRASKEALAESLGMNPRTLLRKLQDTGTTYRALAHEVRLDLARRYLVQPMQPLAFIATHLGFQDPQSFTRWFRDQTGESPSAYRTRHER